MRRTCRNCLCHSCLNTCCDRKQCKGKRKKCKRYSGFRQLSIFDPPPKPKRYKAPRYSWDYYGISRERYHELTEYIRSGRYAALASSAAYTANKDIAEYLLLSVKKNISYDAFQKRWDLGEMEQMPYCRTDFYGYRREFYHYFDVALRRENGKKAK